MEGLPREFKKEYEVGVLRSCPTISLLRWMRGILSDEMRRGLSLDLPSGTARKTSVPTGTRSFRIELVPPLWTLRWGWITSKRLRELIPYPFRDKAAVQEHQAPQFYIQKM